MFRLFVLLAALLCVTPAKAESAQAAAVKRAVIEAHCPPFSKGHAVRATICRSTAMRPVIAQYAPASLGFFNEMVEAGVASAKKFDAGEITAEQYLSETHAQAAEFEAKTDEGSRNWEQAQRQEQCNKIIQAMASPWITPGLEAAALEKLRNLGCLK